MKHMADNSATRQLLSEWSGSRRLLVASHYFTIYGTPLQKSLEGLFRSILYGILREEPSLIAKVVPLRLEEVENEQPPWTQRELEEALRRVQIPETVEVSICFFIDGLDEYTGDHFEICQTLRKLSLNPHIKLCVSSRPWNVFEDAFGSMSGAKLYMQDLTHNDICRYTDSVLRLHPRWDALEEETGRPSSEALVGEVVNKANGVFL